MYIWIDILGFSDSISDEGRYAELIDLVTKFRDKFENVSGIEKIINISDGIVIIKEAKGRVDIESFFKELGNKQLEFIKENNHYLRGGIGLGTLSEAENNLHENEDLKYLVSNGLTKAYSLEEKFVSYPVIGTDEETLEKLKKLPLVNDDRESFGLEKCYSEYSNNNKPLYFIDFIDNDESIKEKLLNKIELHNGVTKVKHKYIWLYHYRSQKFDSKTPCHLKVIIE